MGQVAKSSDFDKGQIVMAQCLGTLISETVHLVGCPHAAVVRQITTVRQITSSYNSGDQGNVSQHIVHHSLLHAIANNALNVQDHLWVMGRKWHT
ncbi:hypothetical protein QQF64_022140 [Cirrhinus molitorella]|uniref:Uncharacterized protein n=1 Tax=Cirrhinus molitorella TaxID=172907 RepID=A0ABR3L7H0_9TELE